MEKPPPPRFFSIFIMEVRKLFSLFFTIMLGTVRLYSKSKIQKSEEKIFHKFTRSILLIVVG